MKKLFSLMTVCVLAMGALTGCSEGDKFWSAMKGDAASAAAFLKSDKAKADAPIFFKILWKGALWGYQAAGGNAKDFAMHVTLPYCSAIASASGGTGVTIEQIEAIGASMGKNLDLSQYDPIATGVNPVMEWFVQTLGANPTLLIFYVHTAAQAGVDVAGSYQ